MKIRPFLVYSIVELGQLGVFLILRSPVLLQWK